MRVSLRLLKVRNAMKPGIPWSVKGIGNDAREAAKVAARRSGMTLGEWLNSVILESSDAPPAYDDRAGLRPPQPRREEQPIRLEDLAQQLARLTQRDHETAPARAYEPPPPRPSLDEDALTRIASRMETSERQTIEAFSAVNERLAALGNKIAEGAKTRYPERPEDVPGYQALEGAMRNIVGHIETSEKRTRDALKSMQERMGEMASRANGADSERILQNAPTITRLESRLAELGARLERNEVSAQRELPAQFSAQVNALAERVETVRQASEHNSTRAETAASVTAQRELREIEGRIQTLLNDTQASMHASTVSGQDLQRVRGDVEGLGQRLDDLRAEAASERDLGALRIAIEQLSTRVAQGPDMRPLADMDRRLADITTRLEQNAINSSESRLAPQIAELKNRIYGLDQRLAEALHNGGTTRAVQALEQQISMVADRLGQTEQQVGHLARLEGSIAQLYDSIEQSKGWSRDVAEDAASRMAERVLQNQQQMMAGFQPAMPAHTGPSPELRALEEGLAAVRAAAHSSDSRNQETLEAVHETLEQIVNKLAEMEMAREPAPMANLAVAPQVPDWAQAPAPMAQYGTPEAPAFPLPETPAYFQPEPQAYVPTPSPMDFAPQQSQAMPGLAPPAFPEFTMAPAPTGSADQANVAVREDFIAAARRAAQAAAAQSGGAASMRASTSGIGQDKKSRFSIPFLNRAKPALQSATGAPHMVATGNKRNSYIVAGLVLLAVSALAYKNFIGSSAPDLAPVDPPAIENAPAMEMAPDQGSGQGATPPKPRPAELESGMPAPDTLQVPGDKTGMAEPTDEILTGALPSRADASIASLIADPDLGGEVQRAAEMPPAEAGPDSLRQAAAQGNSAAQFIVASNYLDGKSVTQDFTKAAKWYQLAAAKGLAPAQYRIATLFERGRGVPQDIAAARVWYERAAERGNVKAMHNAAVILSSTQEGQPDYLKAAKWFTAAAEHGLKDSQYNLAVLHERGLGVKLNMGEALFWYNLAARQNDGDAMKKAAMLEQSLAPATVSDVKTRLVNWTAREAVVGANIVSMQDASWGQQQTAAATDTMATQSIGAIEPMKAPQGDLTQQAQTLLIGLGYDIGEADGKMGARTANAIRLFELQSGMKVTGRASTTLVDKLRAKRG